MKLEEIPELPGWVALTDVARELDVTRQATHKMIRAGKLKSIHKIGPIPVYIIDTNERDRLVKERTEAREAAAVAAQQPAAE